MWEAGPGLMNGDWKAFAHCVYAGAKELDKGVRASRRELVRQPQFSLGEGISVIVNELKKKCVSHSRGALHAIEAAIDAQLN